MKQVYLPANAPEAHMLAHLLEQAGIKAHIHGEALQGASGELPVTGTLQVLVADDEYDHARSVIEDWEKSIEPVEAEKTTRRFPTSLALLFAVLGLIGGWVLRTAVVQNHVSFGDRIETEDRNGDGRIDATWFYRPGDRRPYKADFDHNHDGRIDVHSFYDDMGLLTEQDEDDDFDGTFERKAINRDGEIIRSEVDTDRNGIADDSTFYANGVAVREELTDAQYGSVVRVNYYLNHNIDHADIDLNRDGFRETRRTFDRFGEIVRTETLPRER